MLFLFKYLSHSFEITKYSRYIYIYIYILKIIKWQYHCLSN
ncbi:MAG: hypothetical protein N7Q72_07040 [Spiroplasma sp. Tabriz.8]|nr:hypothetical protein [Spiroplasma sp. Tabriz.8]